MHEPNAQQAEFWDEITTSWLVAERHSELVAGPFGELAMRRLGLSPGDRVLDIGCGSGGTTLALAEAVGPEGSACGIDLAPGMIDAARARAAAADDTTTSFLTIDAQTSDLHGPFDAAFSRFGVMFFADPVAAFANVASVVVREGRLAFCCWRDLFENEWMFVPGAAAIAVTGEFPTMPGPGEPGPFSLADPDIVTAMLNAAGYEDVEIEPVALTIALPADQVASVTEMSQHVGPVREALRTADDETAAAIVAAVGDALRGKVTEGELRLSAGANIVTATVSGWRR